MEKPANLSEETVEQAKAKALAAAYETIDNVYSDHDYTMKGFAHNLWTGLQAIFAEVRTAMTRNALTIAEVEQLTNVIGILKVQCEVLGGLNGEEPAFDSPKLVEQIKALVKTHIEDAEIKCYSTRASVVDDLLREEADTFDTQAERIH
jgi:hypothetical protein